MTYFQPPNFQCFSSQCALHGLRSLDSWSFSPSFPTVEAHLRPAPLVEYVQQSAPVVEYVQQPVPVVEYVQQPTSGVSRACSSQWSSSSRCCSLHLLVPYHPCYSDSFRGNGMTQERKRPHKLKKNPRDAGRVSLGHPAGQMGVYWLVSRGFPVVYYRKSDNKKRHFCRDTGRVSH